MNQMKAIAAGLMMTCAAIAVPVAGQTAETLSGSYLSGQHAANKSDIEAAARYYASALRRDPGNAGLMEQALVFQAAAGQIEQALMVAKTLEAAQPGHRMAALMLTAEAFRRGDLADAKARIGVAPTAYHPLVGAMLDAWAKFGLGEVEAAETSFDVLEDRPVFQIFAGYHKGLMRQAAGNEAGAVEAFAGIVSQMQVPTGRVARAYGASLRANGANDEALKIYQGAMAASVSDAILEAEVDALKAGAAPVMLVSTAQEGAAEALFGLAAALGRDGEERLSLFYTRIAMWLRPGFDDAALLAAELLQDEGQYDLAISVYEEIPVGNPLSRTAEIGRAEALRLKGSEAEAAEALRAVIRREPDAIDAHIALGDILRRGEKYAESAVAYDTAITLMEAADRPNWVLYYERGISRERSGQWDGAEADFFRALELKPDQPLVLNYLGYSWLEKGVNLDRALAMIQKAVEQRSDDGYIVDSLGWAYYLLEDYPKAVAELERAVELRPIDPVINDHFGDALWQVGRKLEAQFQWRRSLSFEPEPEAAALTRRKLADGLDIVAAEEAARKDASAAPAPQVKDGG